MPSLFIDTFEREHGRFVAPQCTGLTRKSHVVVRCEFRGQLLLGLSLSKSTVWESNLAMLALQGSQYIRQPDTVYLTSSALNTSYHCCVSRLAGARYVTARINALE